MKGKVKSYPLSSSPFFRLSSKKKLSKLLFTTERRLCKVASGDSAPNFHVTNISGREVHIPKQLTRQFHNRIFRLLQRIETPSFLHSGVKRRSHATNAISHVKNGEEKALTIDIKRFYDSTPKRRIYNLFREKFECSPDVAGILANLCCYGDKLPTGSPISQCLAFWSNESMFNKIANISSHLSITFTLYVDDLSFSGERIDDDFLLRIRQVITSFGYESHKIKRLKPSDIKPITGSVIHPKNGLMVRASDWKKIRALRKEIHELKKAKNPEETQKKYEQLIGTLYACAQIDKNFTRIAERTCQSRRDWAKTSS
jgi:hypothetical protein